MSTAKKDWKSRKIKFIDWVYVGTNTDLKGCVVGKHAQRSGFEKYFTFSIGLKD